MQLLFSVVPGEAVQLRSYLHGIYAALPVPLPLKPEWLAMLLPAAAAEEALSLHPRGECLNRYMLYVHCVVVYSSCCICREQQRVRYPAFYLCVVCVAYQHSILLLFTDF